MKKRGLSPTVLNGLPFVIIKSHGRDKYDRHLIDLYYLRNAEPEIVPREGVFLNQELLNKGLANLKNAIKPTRKIN